MNALTGLDEHEAGSSGPAEPRLHTLRRTGRKAVRFTGWQLVEARGAASPSASPGAMWYDLALYRSVADAIIVELVARRSLVDEPDLCRVEVFPDLQHAASWLEDYPCAQDVPIPVSLAAADAPMVLSVLQAVQLRQRIARINDDYQGLLSEVFEALDITAAETQPDRPVCADTPA
jgi:hypothetical protein